MKKNVASQVVGVQMITAADGTAFTSATTVVVTVDGGTQSASGGTGPTHEGNGFFTYLPTQAETNGDHIGFTFTGSGAIPTTVQVYTTFPQTGDNFAIVDGAAGLVAIDTVVDELKVAVITNAVGADISADMLTAQNDLDIITGASGVNLLTATQASIDAIETDTNTTLQAELDAIQAAVITNAVGVDISADIATAQADLDIITGASGVNLLTATQASIDAIETDTGTTLPALLPAALVGGRMDSNVGAISGDATAADLLEASMETLVVGTASAGTTSQVTTDITGHGDDTFIGRVMLMRTGTMQYEAGVITDYASATGVFDFAASTWTTSATSETVVVV